MAGISQLSDAQLRQFVARNGPLDVLGPGTAYPLIRCVAGFLLGMVAFRAWRAPSARLLAGRRFAADAVVLAVAALMLVRGSDVALVAMFAPLVAALACGRSLSAAALASPPVHWLGVISYSLYLVHGPIQILLREPVGAALRSAGVPHAFVMESVVLAALSLAAAAAAYALIERPGRDLSRRLLAFRSDRARVAAR